VAFSATSPLNYLLTSQRHILFMTRDDLEQVWGWANEKLATGVLRGYVRKWRNDLEKQLDRLKLLKGLVSGRAGAAAA
jgi:hypothetical protein